jgi:hypothetical protein
MIVKHALLAGSLLTSAMLLTACGGDDSEETYQYKLEITNLTYAQPLSPAAILLHTPDYQLFSEGETASLALEQLAESGSVQEILNETQQEEAVFFIDESKQLILPGETYEYELTVDVNLTAQAMSIATMLVNTNDAFTGINSEVINDLAIDQSQIFYGPVWDAGTEFNSESSATIPGPAAGGEGFNSQRDDLNKVIFHPGVVSLDDGLEGSALTEQHRFNQPASLIRITRLR